MRISLFWRTIPFYSIVLIAVLLSFWQNHVDAVDIASSQINAEKNIHNQPANFGVKVIEGLAYKIVLPSLQLDLQVVSGVYNPIQKSWSLNPYAANYATNTSENNNIGNKTLIYGHDTVNVFEKTSRLHAGDSAYVYTSNNHVFKYVYRENQLISYTDVGVFNNLTGAPGLVLMTCDGFWNQYRRLSLFDLVSES